MAKSFNLVLTGKTVPGTSPEAAAAALAKVLRVPEARARELLSGKETVIKRGLSEEMLAPYLDAVRKCGAEARADEAAVAAPGTVKCPACGTEQPPRTLCIKCGVDMKRIAAAQAEAKAPPTAPKSVQQTSKAALPAARVDPLDRPFYRRTLLIELLCFLVLTPLWAVCTVIDSARAKAMRVFAGALLLLWGVGLAASVLDHAGYWRDDEAAVDAYNHAIHAAESVERYAVKNQRFPDAAGALALRARPEGVKSVDIGPAGRVLVTLDDGVKKWPGGTITLTPNVDDKGEISWDCELGEIRLTEVERACRALR